MKFFTSPLFSPPTVTQQGLPSVRGYQVLKEIGSGRNATVYEGRNEQGEPVALKRLEKDEAQRELDALRRLKSSRYVAEPLASPVSVNGAVFVPMPLFDATLTEVEVKGLLPAAFARLVILPAAKLARDCERAGLVVTDLNPNNLMLRQSRKGTVVQLIDLGSAVPTGRVRADELEYTESWAAPELGLRMTSAKTLCWSFGALTRWAAGLYWHTVQVGEEDILTAAPWLGQPLARLVSRCSSQPPCHRPQPSELEREVARILKQSEDRCRAGHATFLGSTECACGEPLR